MRSSDFVSSKELQYRPDAAFLNLKEARYYSALLEDKFGFGSFQIVSLRENGKVRGYGIYHAFLRKKHVYGVPLKSVDKLLSVEEVKRICEEES